MYAYVYAVLMQVLSSTTEIEMWGDGKQTRSFTFIDDCVEGILRVTKSDYREPLNLGSDEMVSMNEMMEMAMSFEGKVRQRVSTMGELLIFILLCHVMSSSCTVHTL